MTHGDSNPRSRQIPNGLARLSQLWPRIIVSPQRKANCAFVCVGNDVFVRDEEITSQLGARFGVLPLVLEDESGTDGAFRLDPNCHEQEVFRCRHDFHRVPSIDGSSWHCPRTTQVYRDLARAGAGVRRLMGDWAAYLAAERL